MASSEHTLELYEHIFKLKRLDRFGWTKYPTKSPESVAEHSFGLAILALSIAPKIGLDTSKAVTIALIHDLGESIIGDIQSPENEEAEKEKHSIEGAAIKKILPLLSEEPKKLEELWQEFEEGSSAEAKFIKELDKIEMCLQALSYEKEQSLSLDEFFDHTEKRLTIPELVSLFQEIKSQRDG